jgi:hypothetical protein
MDSIEETDDLCEKHCESLKEKTLTELKSLHEKTFGSAFKGNDKEKICYKIANFRSSSTKEKKVETYKELSPDKAKELLHKIIKCHQKVDGLKSAKKTEMDEQKKNVKKKEDELDNNIFKDPVDLKKQITEIQMGWSQVKQLNELYDQTNKDFLDAIKKAKEELYNTMNDIRQESFDFGV